MTRSGAAQSTTNMREFCVAALVAVCFASACVAAPPADQGESADLRRSTQAGVALLADIEDGEFSFDDEGFYWFCGFLREHPDALARTDCQGEDVVPWQYLMERPSDYRGRAVCIEGRFLREQPPYDVDTRPGVGRLRQVDMGVAGSNAIATLVLVDPPPKTPKRSLIRAHGFFIKVRSFRTEGGGEGAGPLFVARSFEILESAGGFAGTTSRWGSRDILTAMAATTVVLFFVVVFVRKRLATSATPMNSESDRPRVSGTGADFDWLDESASHDERPRNE